MAVYCGIELALLSARYRHLVTLRSCTAQDLSVNVEAGLDAFFSASLRCQMNGNKVICRSAWIMTLSCCKSNNSDKTMFHSETFRIKYIHFECFWAWFFNYTFMFQMWNSNNGTQLYACVVLEKSFGYWRLCGCSTPNLFRLMVARNIPVTINHSHNLSDLFPRPHGKGCPSNCVRPMGRAQWWVAAGTIQWIKSPLSFPRLRLAGIIRSGESGKTLVDLAVLLRGVVLFHVH